MIIHNSDRLSFQIMDESNAQDLFELDQNPEVMKYINGRKPSSKQDIENKMLPRMVSYTNQQKGWGIWKVIVIQSNAFIGWVLVRPMDFFTDNPQFNDLELGWRFKQESWGKGYATEAAKHIMQALIENKSATQYSAIAETENTASIGIMKKLGMQFIKNDLHKDPLGDMQVDYYSLKV
jgi:RimJ/RimL family protein N-acetyltransferase